MILKTLLKIVLRLLFLLSVSGILFQKVAQ